MITKQKDKSMLLYFSYHAVTNIVSKLLINLIKKMYHYFYDHFLCVIVFMRQLSTSLSREINLKNYGGEVLFLFYF
jgi:hypothetical protein